MIKKHVKLSEVASLDQRFYRMWYMCDIRITELSCIFNKKRSKSFDTAALILRSFSTIWQTPQRLRSVPAFTEHFLPCKPGAPPHNIF